MKRIFHVFAIVLALGTSAMAQESGFGLKVGLNVTTPGGDLKESTTAGLGFNFGAIYQYMVTDNIAIQPEIHFSNENISYDDDSDFKLKHNYLNIPIVGKFYLSEYVNLQAGIQAGILLSATVTDGDFSASTKDNYNATNISIPLGAGVVLDNGLMIDLRYNIGLSNVAKDAGDYTAKLSTINLSFGYQF